MDSMYMGEQTEATSVAPAQDVRAEQPPKDEEEYQGAGVLKLKKPLMLDGREVQELPYDFDALTTKDVIEVDTERSRGGGNPVYVQSFDPGFKTRLFARAVGKKLPNCTYEDLLRLPLRDGAAAMALSAGFLSESSRDGEA